MPEADPTNHSVGYGGYPDRDGHVTLDAIIMDERGGVGAVAALEDIVHAVSVARLVMEKTPHTLLVGEGATRFALDQGMKPTKLLTPEAEKAWRDWLKTANYRPVANIENRLPGRRLSSHDTIGIMARGHALRWPPPRDIGHGVQDAWRVGIHFEQVAIFLERAPPLLHRRSGK